MAGLRCAVSTRRRGILLRQTPEWHIKKNRRPFRIRIHIKYTEHTQCGAIALWLCVPVPSHFSTSVSTTRVPRNHSPRIFRFVYVIYIFGQRAASASPAKKYYREKRALQRTHTHTTHIHTPTGIPPHTHTHPNARKAMAYRHIPFCKG